MEDLRTAALNSHYLLYLLLLSRRKEAACRLTPMRSRYLGIPPLLVRTSLPRPRLRTIRCLYRSDNIGAPISGSYITSPLDTPMCSRSHETESDIKNPPLLFLFADSESRDYPSRVVEIGVMPVRDDLLFQAFGRSDISLTPYQETQRLAHCVHILERSMIC